MCYSEKSDIFDFKCNEYINVNIIAPSCTSTITNIQIITI